MHQWFSVSHRSLAPHARRTTMTSAGVPTGQRPAAWRAASIRWPHGSACALCPKSSTPEAPPRAAKNRVRQTSSKTVYGRSRRESLPISPDGRSRRESLPISPDVSLDSTQSSTRRICVRIYSNFWRKHLKLPNAPKCRDMSETLEFYDRTDDLKCCIFMKR